MGRLGEKVEELAQRPPPDLRELSTHILVRMRQIWPAIPYMTSSWPSSSSAFLSSVSH